MMMSKRQQQQSAEDCARRISKLQKRYLRLKKALVRLEPDEEEEENAEERGVESTNNNNNNNNNSSSKPNGMYVTSVIQLRPRCKSC